MSARRRSGELPPDNIVEIGDGFYVVQNPDGSRATVILDRSKVPVARVERFDAAPDRYVAELETGSPPRRNWRGGEHSPLTGAALYEAKARAFQDEVDEYARQVERYAQLAEQAGITSEHPPVNAMLGNAPKLEVPELEIPEPHRLEFPPRPAPQ